MIKNYKIGAMLILLAFYSSPSISAAAKNVKCNGCVGTKDIKNNAVTGAKIKNGSVSIKDLSPTLQGDITALGIDIKILEGQPKAKVGFDVPDNNLDRSNGHPFGTIYIRLGTNDVFISREAGMGAAIWEQLTPKKYAIGDVGPAGGWVFYVTDDGLHGLEAAPIDQSISAPWGCLGTNLPGATSLAVGAGARNTGDILQGCTAAGIAAALAGDYVSPSGYFDWFLPSEDELALMYINIGQGSTTIGNVGGFDNRNYWSSSESGINSARILGFFNGVDGNGSKSVTSVGSRAVRAF